MIICYLRWIEYGALFKGIHALTKRSMLFSKPLDGLFEGVKRVLQAEQIVQVEGEVESRLRRASLYVDLMLTGRRYLRGLEEFGLFHFFSVTNL